MERGALEGLATSFTTIDSGTQLALARLTPSLSFLAPLPLLEMKPPWPIPVYSGATQGGGKLVVKTPFGILRVPVGKARLVWARPPERGASLVVEGAKLPVLAEEKGEAPDPGDLPLPKVRLVVDEVVREPRAITIGPGVFQVQLPGYAVSRTPGLPAPVSVIVPGEPGDLDDLRHGVEVEALFIYAKYGRLQPLTTGLMTSSNANVLLYPSPGRR